MWPSRSASQERRGYVSLRQKMPLCIASCDSRLRHRNKCIARGYISCAPNFQPRQPSLHSLSSSRRICFRNRIVSRREHALVRALAVVPGLHPITPHSHYTPLPRFSFSSPHFALFFAASASLLVASSNSAVSTAPEGKCTYRTTEPRINMSFVEHYNTRQLALCP